MKPGSLALIATVTIVSFAAFVGSQSGQAQGGAVAPQIEGTWLTTVTIPDGPPPFPALLTFGAGGGLAVTDSSAPPVAGNVYQGTWARKGNHKFAFTVMGFNYDATGVLVGMFKIREHLEIEPSGNAYNGVWAGEVLDPAGNVVVSGFGGTTHGTRINAE